MLAQERRKKGARKAQILAEKVGIWRKNGARKAQILAEKVGIWRKNGARIAQVGAKAQSKIDYIYYMGAECSIKLSCKIPGIFDKEYDE